MEYIKIAILLIIALSFFALAQKYTQSIFWICIMLYFDPGGIVAGYGGGNIIGRLNSSDVFFAIMTILFILKYPSLLRVNQTLKETKSFIIWTIIFLFYLLIFYGFYIPILKGYPNFIRFLIKSRYFFYIPFIFFYTYHFSMIDNKSRFIKYTIYTTLIITPLFLFSIVSNVEIIPVLTMERFAGSGMQRLFMYSYGFINLSFYFALIILLEKNYINLSAQIKRKIVFAGFLMVIVLLITLTRREIIRIITIPLIISYIISKIERRSFFIKINKILISAIIVLALISFTFPQNFKWLVNTVKDTAVLITTGEDTEGNTDERLNRSGGMIYAIDYIQKNLWFGSGYYPYSFEEVEILASSGDPVAIGLNSSAEVPIYGSLQRLGLIGILFFLPLYLIPLKIIRSFYLIIKKNPESLLHINGFDIIIIIFFITYIIQKFTLEIFTLFQESINPSYLTKFAILFAIFLAAKNRLYQQLKNKIS